MRNALYKSQSLSVHEHTTVLECGAQCNRRMNNEFVMDADGLHAFHVFVLREPFPKVQCTYIQYNTKGVERPYIVLEQGCVY